MSEDQTTNSDLVIGPEERSIALYQAARYSQHCRVFAPMYRQLTLAAILSGDPIPPEAAELAYADVLSAWKAYLKKENDGRGVVFVGHSQGSVLLRNLLREEVDPKRKVRKRLVSALLYGGNVLVAKGERVGGDFEHIPGCRKGDEIGCVVAWSAFDEPVPPDSLYGRPSPGGFFGEIALYDLAAFALVGKDELDALCRRGCLCHTLHHAPAGRTPGSRG